jgi:hypothetical protein
MAPSVAMQGGPGGEDLLERYPPARRAKPEDVTSVLAAVTGYFVHHGLLPAPPGLPTLRPFQIAQGEAGLAWLRERTGLT